MKKQIKYTLSLVLVGLIWLSLVLGAWIKPSDDLSLTERRKLEQFPVINSKDILDASFMEDFEKYSLDQFPFRDRFRTIKSISAFYIFRQKDNNDIYISNGHAAKLEYPLHENSLQSAAKKSEKLVDMYFNKESSNIFLSIIPDKGYFMAEDNGYPSIDYDKLVSVMRENMDFAEYVDIFSTLNLDYYYKTDTHWRQEHLIDTAKKLALGLRYPKAVSGNYTQNTADVDFYGVYYGQSALPLDSEKIYYLTNDILNSITMYNVENSKTTGIYDYEKIQSRDPYEMFMSGGAAILQLNNPNAPKDKKIVVFRDSFASSILPLLAEGYSQMTVIDTRYVSPEHIGSFVQLDADADVLFLYSAPILNNSSMLR